MQMKTYGKNVMPAVVTGGILAVWQLAVEIFRIPMYVLPSPVQVMRALAEERWVLAGHGAVTVGEALVGIGISLVLAVVLGVVMDCFPLMRRGIYPILVVTQTVPMIVMAPILIIYMGECKRAHNMDIPKRPALTIPQQEAFIRYTGEIPKYKHWKPLFTFFLGTGCQVKKLVDYCMDTV